MIYLSSRAALSSFSPASSIAMSCRACVVRPGAPWVALENAKHLATKESLDRQDKKRRL
jgi:hypothetical protein